MIAFRLLQNRRILEDVHFLACDAQVPSSVKSSVLSATVGAERPVSVKYGARRHQRSQRKEGAKT